MRLEPIESPQIFPPSVAVSAVRLIGGDHRWHFDAGRECAARAMAGLGATPGPIGRGPAGEPLWPAGVTGSITHKGDVVAAAVARTSDVLGLGIDAEVIVDADRAARIASRVLLPREAAVGGDALAEALRLSIVFSIKESIYKCLYPLVQRRFYYEAVAVTDVDCEAGTFLAEVAIDLSPAFRAGHVLEGRLAAADPRLFTGIVLPRG